MTKECSVATAQLEPAGATSCAGFSRATAELWGPSWTWLGATCTRLALARLQLSYGVTNVRLPNLVLSAPLMGKAFVCAL